MWLSLFFCRQPLLELIGSSRRHHKESSYRDNQRFGSSTTPEAVSISIAIRETFTMLSLAFQTSCSIAGQPLSATCPCRQLQSSSITHRHRRHNSRSRSHCSFGQLCRLLRPPISTTADGSPASWELQRFLRRLLTKPLSSSSCNNNNSSNNNNSRSSSSLRPATSVC